MRANRPSAGTRAPLGLALTLTMCLGCQLGDGDQGLKLFSSPFAKHDLDDDDEFIREVNKDPFPTASRQGMKAPAKNEKK